MDAARSAWRSGASPVTDPLSPWSGRHARPGRGDRGGRARGHRRPDRISLRSRCVEPRRRGRSRIRCTGQRADRARPSGGDARTPGSRSRARSVELPVATILVAVGEEPDPSILPEGAGIEVSGWAGIVADPRTLATGRAGIFAGGDVVSGPRRSSTPSPPADAQPRSIHEYLAGVADGEASILATVRYPTRPRTHAHARPRPPASGPRAAAHGPARLVRGDAGRLRRDHRSCARPVACFRCDALYGCPLVEVRAGRGPMDRPRPDPPTRPRHRDRWRHTMTPDQVSGLLRRR